MWIPDPRFEMPELLIPNQIPHGRVRLEKYKDYLLWLYNDLINVGIEYNQKYTMVVSGSVPWEGKGGGSIVFTENANNYIQITGDVHLPELRSSELTTVTRFMAPNATIGAFGGYMHGQSDDYTTNIDYSIAVKDDDIRVLWGNSGGGYIFHDTTSNEIQDGVWYTVVHRRKGSASNWTSDIFLNNKNWSTTTTAQNSGTQYGFDIGRIGTGVPYSGYISMILYIFEALPDGQCMELQRNPYSLFEPA